MFYEYRVGEFLPDVEGHDCQDACYYDFGNKGPELIYLFRNPSPVEILEFRFGVAHFRVFMTSGIIFFLSKLGTGPWNDSPYHRSISGNLQFLDYPEDGQGYELHCILADALTGEIMAERTIELPTEFSRQLREVIRQQPNITPDYGKRLKLAYKTYTTLEMARNAQIK